MKNVVIEGPGERNLLKVSAIRLRVQRLNRFIYEGIGSYFQPRSFFDGALGL